MGQQLRATCWPCRLPRAHLRGARPTWTSSSSRQRWAHARGLPFTSDASIAATGAQHGFATYVRYCASGAAVLTLCAQGLMTGADYSGKKTTLVLFINGRPVECSPLKRALELTYSRLLPKAAKPFLFLVLPSSLLILHNTVKHQTHRNAMTGGGLASSCTGGIKSVPL